MQQSNDGLTTAPYVSFKTFLTALESLEQGVPTRIDRSIWPNLSGASQSHLLAAFRFLGLIDDDGNTQDVLERLVNNKEKRKEILRSAIENAYRDIVSIDLTKATQMQLDEAMRQNYGVKGSTLRKANTFLMQACQYADIPVSPLLTQKMRNYSSSSKRKKTPAKTPKSNIDNTRNTEIVQNENEKPLVQQGTSKTINLHGGGSLTLIVSVDVFAMTQDDRKFVFGLIDQLNDYEQNVDIEDLDIEANED